MRYATLAAAILGALQSTLAPPVSDKITGVVVDRNDRRVPRARVRIRWQVHATLGPPSGSILPDRRKARQDTIACDDEGSFVFRAKPGVSYTLGAIHGRTSVSPPRFPVVGGDQVRLVVAPMQTMQGRVVNEDGKPIAGATVTADVRQQEILGPSASWPYRTQTGASGAFTLRVADVESYALRVEAEGFSTIRRSGRRGKRHDVTLPNLVEVSGEVIGPNGQSIEAATVLATYATRIHGRTETAKNGRFRFRVDKRADTVQVLALGCERAAVGLRTDPIELKRGVRIRRQLLDAKGRALKDTRVYAAGPFDGVQTHHFLEWLGRTDDRGRLEMSFLQAGKPIVAFAETPTGWIRVVLAKPTRDLELDPIRLTGDSRIRGRVVTAEGDPIRGSAVMLHRVPSTAAGKAAEPHWVYGRVVHRVVHTNQHGWFVATGLEPADYRIAATSRNQGSARTLSKADGKAVTLRMPAGTLRGTAVDEQGVALAGAKVVATRKTNHGDPLATGTHYFWTRSDSDGRFVFSGMKRGETLELSASHRPAGGAVRRTKKRVSPRVGDGPIELVLQAR